MMGRVLALCLGAWLAMAPGLARAQALGLFTIVEGEVAVLRGPAARLGAEPGMRLQADDIVETAQDTPLARVELADGTALDLGPGTRLWFQPRGAAERGRRLDSYLLQGWVKLSPSKAADGGRAVRSLSSPLGDLTGLSGIVVAHVAADRMAVFVESGEARLVERRGGKAQPATALKAGEFHARVAPERGSVAPRPAPDFLAAMPRAFRDTLPDLAGRYQDQPVEGRPLPDAAYADVADWLKGEPVIRRASLVRWRSRAQEPAFRTGLVANLKSHLEWDRVLFPEKYLPKPAPAPQARP